MNVSLGKEAFTPEEIDDLRDRLRVHKQQRGLSWTDLAQQTDVPHGTLSAWVPGTYNGGKIHQNMEIPAKIHRFFVSLAEQAELDAIMPVAPAFLMTPSAKRMMTALAIAKRGDMVMISGTPGCGKTAVNQQFAATRGLVTIATASPSNRGINTLLISVLAAMGEANAKGTPQALSERIRTRVRDTEALIIIDEAQHLSQPALEELRSIHDATGCGIALVGDEYLVANLKKYPQLHSRLGIRLVLPRPLPEDVAIIAAGWGVEKGGELSYLQDIARKSGGLRTVTKTMALAVQIARAGSAPLAIEDMRDAYTQRYGEGA